MSQKSGQLEFSSERVVKNIRRVTREHYSTENIIRIVLDGLLGEDSIAEFCRREGVANDLLPWNAPSLGLGSVMEKETDDEAEPVHGRTDYRDIEGASGRAVGGRSLPPAWHQRFSISGARSTTGWKCQPPGG